MLEEWAGQTSSKFNGNKRHVAEPEIKHTKHPLYEAEQRKHFSTRVSDQYRWKPCMKTIEGAAQKVSPCTDEWVPSNKPKRVFTEAKDRPEKKHLMANPSGTYEEQDIGLKTFIDIHNRKSINEYSTENRMG